MRIADVNKEACRISTATQRHIWDPQILERVFKTAIDDV